MTRQTRLKTAIRFAAATAVGCVAVFVSSPLFAQSRAEIAVSATVLAPAQPTAITRTPGTFANHYTAMVSDQAEQRNSHPVGAITTKESMVKSESRQTAIITIEYGAN